MSAIVSAIQRNDLQSVKELLECRCCGLNDRDVVGRTPLHIASQCGYVNTVKYLVEKCAFVNGLDWDGNTPLNTACFENKQNSQRNIRDTIEYLVEHNAKVNTEDKEGNGPLQSLLKLGRDIDCDTIKCLVEHGSDVNKKDNDGMLPLHLILQRGPGTGHVVECLVKHGADVNLKDKIGRTPLHVALQRGCKHAVECLVEGGASIDDLDWSMIGTLESTSRLEERRIITILKNNAASVS